MIRSCVFCLAFFFLSGCALVGPDYTPPQLTLPASYHAELGQGLAAVDPDPATLARWWTQLDDATLSELEERAVAGNLDLAAAVARVKQARAQLQASHAGLVPRVDLGGSATKSRSSANVSGVGRESELYDLAFDAGWEIDLFGGVRRGVQAAEANLAASRAGLAGAVVSLTGEVARVYLEYRTLESRLATLKANVAILEQEHDLTLDRYRAGLADELAVAQARGLLEQARARIPELQRGMSAAANALALLAGEPPGAMDDLLVQARPLPQLPATIAVGVPAELVRRRPDVQRAERLLAAQSARIGVATADLYPHLRISGSVGLESLHPEDLPEWLSRTFRLGPSLSWNLFDGGRNRAMIAVEDARYQEALANYRQAVLAALREVEDGMVAFVRHQDQLHALTIAKQALDQAAELAEDRYRAGIADYLAVLDARRAAVNVDDQLAQARGEVAADVARLYKALGGGWVMDKMDSMDSMD